jgi:GAF domain
MAKYGHAVHRRNVEGDVRPGQEIDLPTLPDVQSRVAVPAMALGQLVGVLVVEGADAAAFGDGDEAVLTAVASVVGNAIEVGRSQSSEETDRARMSAAATLGLEATGAVTLVRYFPVDGSTFLDGDYLIKGVAGRLLWALLGHHEREGRNEFTNREVRLDPSLELPEFRQNLESRLILLKRRLDEREAPIRIEKSGRGRFRLLVGSALQLESVDSA